MGKRKQIRLLIISGVLLIFLSFGFLKINDRDFEIVKNLDIFYTMFRELNLFYVDDIEPEKIINTGINSMLNSLDPYTVFIPEAEMDEFKFQTTGEYGGIGAVIRQTEDFTLIVEPYEDFPAARSGLKAGDKLISVNGLSTKNLPVSEVSDNLKGLPGTEIKLIVKSPGEKNQRSIKLTREQIRIKNVSYSGKLDENTGYIRLSNFTLGAGDEVKKAFTDLKQQGINKLILDLRGNPGGILMEAVKVCNIFINKGELIVSTKGKVKQWDQNYYTIENPTDTEIPLVILISRSSASAAEIVAGAVQDLDRGVLIGQRTFGKGLVQTTRKLKYNALLKVTTAKYYIPSGRCIQALDYTHRNEDGSVGNIPDSLITEFSTKRGRKVFDGGGISPDIPDINPAYAQVTMYLYARNMFFDFATDYYIRHRNANPDPEKFSIKAKEYDNFRKMIAGKNFSYITKSEEALAKLMEAAKNERYYEYAESEFKALINKLNHNNDTDLELFREEITQLLNEEIISRYHFQKGRIVNSLNNDNQVITALKIINDTLRYPRLIGL